MLLQNFKIFRANYRLWKQHIWGKEVDRIIQHLFWYSLNVSYSDADTFARDVFTIKAIMFTDLGVRKPIA